MPRPAKATGPVHLLTMDEAARRLSLSTRHLWRLARRGHLHVVHIGRAARIREDDLNAYIDSLSHDPFGGSS